MTLFSAMRTFLLLIALACASLPAYASKTILLFGDSLSAGFGIRQEQAWPALLQKRLREQGLDYNVANLSISGETSAGGRARLKAALQKHQPAVLIVQLGANDGLRGLPLKALRDNLEAMIAEAQQSKTKVLLINMRLPPNYGIYAEAFDRSFGEIANAKHVALSEFFLAGIAGQPQFFQTDGLHPTAEAQSRLLDNVWPTLKPLLR